MKKFYSINQGTYDKNHFYQQPIYPLTLEGLEKMIEWGVAKEINKESSKYANWGSGNYSVDFETGEFNCVANNWDSSG